MNDLACPKCRQPVADDVIDAGQCPNCGFVIDGPIALAGRRMPVLTLAVVSGLLASAFASGYVLFTPPNTGGQPTPELAAITPPDPRVEPPINLAPFPHEPKPQEPQGSGPNDMPGTTPEPVGPPPMPMAVEPPKPQPQEPPKVDPPKPRPVAVVMRVDPKIQPKRHFDQPDDIATLPDLNTGDQVVLTGKLRGLRIGSVNGKATLDASGLVAEEIVITGDLNNEAVVKLNAPNGKVTIGGYIAGASKLTIVAPGGTVVVLATSGRFTGSSHIAVTAKRIEVLGKMVGGTRLNATLTTGGFLKLASMEEGATAIYKRTAPTDPPIIVEKGDIRGGAKIIAE